METFFGAKLEKSHGNGRIEIKLVNECFGAKVGIRHHSTNTTPFLFFN